MYTGLYFGKSVAGLWGVENREQLKTTRDRLLLSSEFVPTTQSIVFLRFSVSNDTPHATPHPHEDYTEKNIVNSN